MHLLYSIKYIVHRLDGPDLQASLSFLTLSESERVTFRPPLASQSDKIHRNSLASLQRHGNWLDASLCLFESAGPRTILPREFLTVVGVQSGA